MDFNTIKALLKQKQRYFFEGDETAFEDYIIDNLDDIFQNIGMAKIGELYRQKLIRISDFYIKPDIMVLHENDELSVIEVKKPNKKHPSTSPFSQCAGIGQLLLYQGIVQELYKYEPFLFLVTEKVHPRTVCVFANYHLPITLIEIQNDRVFISYGLEFVKNRKIEGRKTE